MKNKIILSGLILTVVFGAVAVNGKLFASNLTPGTASDPLVSQSYVDNKFNQLTNLINSSGGGTGASKDVIIAEVMAQIDFFYANKTGASYTPVLATANQIIIGEEGTEIILRSGTAVGYCVGTDGLVNTTDGSEITNNVKIEKNNLLIVPRSDNRGARITSGEAWFIIKGNYTIIN